MGLIIFGMVVSFAIFGCFRLLRHLPAIILFACKLGLGLLCLYWFIVTYEFLQNYLPDWWAFGLTVVAALAVAFLVFCLIELKNQIKLQKQQNIVTMS